MQPFPIFVLMDFSLEVKETQNNVLISVVGGMNMLGSEWEKKHQSEL